jgi:hypothetical protein
MTAARNERGSAYLYAQSLDNSGNNPCLVSTTPSELLELDTSDTVRTALLLNIDSLSNDGWHWQLGTVSLDCRINRRGDCLVTLRPLTRDNSGRLAPIMLLFNIWDDQRQLAAPMLVDGGQLMKREFSAEHLRDIARLQQVMSWPSLLIALHALIFSRRPTHD